MLYSVCHADGMAKKQHSSTTEWHVGQPLACSGIKRAAREALNEAMRGSFSAGRQKRKKK
jgi:hypothetical protein